MKILDARIHWSEGFANSATLEVLVDKIPSIGDLRYARRKYGGGTSYLAEKDGCVSYFRHNPKNQHGFGGSTFTRKDTSGKEFSVKGPWSSSASHMNTAGFGVLCVDVHMTDRRCDWDRGYGAWGGSITVQKAIQAMTIVRERGDRCPYIATDHTLGFAVEGGHGILFLPAARLSGGSLFVKGSGSPMIAHGKDLDHWLYFNKKLFAKMDPAGNGELSGE